MCFFVFFFFFNHELFVLECLRYMGGGKDAAIRKVVLHKEISFMGLVEMKDAHCHTRKLEVGGAQETMIAVTFSKKWWKRFKGVLIICYEVFKWSF